MDGTRDNLNAQSLINALKLKCTTQSERFRDTLERR